jgi:hypothetical protein
MLVALRRSKIHPQSLIPGLIPNRAAPLAGAPLHLIATSHVAAHHLLLFLPAESDPQGLRPRQLRDVPAGKLAFKFSADVDPPTGLPSEESKSIPQFRMILTRGERTKRCSALCRPPDGQRALALYGAADDSNTTSFRIRSLFVRWKLLFATSRRRIWQLSFRIPWFGTNDSNYIAFVGRRNAQPDATRLRSRLSQNLCCHRLRRL